MLICVMVALVAADNDFGYKRSNAMRPEEFLNLGVSTSTSIPNIFSISNIILELFGFVQILQEATKF